jgi:hypothetical protein
MIFKVFDSKTNYNRRQLKTPGIGAIMPAASQPTYCTPHLKVQDLLPIFLIPYFMDI